MLTVPAASGTQAGTAFSAGERTGSNATLLLPPPLACALGISPVSVTPQSTATLVIDELHFVRMLFMSSPQLNCLIQLANVSYASGFQSIVRNSRNTELTTTTPDTPLAEAAHVLMERKIGCLPLVENNRLVGILTEGDFVALYAREGQK
jgi:hypothetical protein